MKQLSLLLLPILAAACSRGDLSALNSVECTKHALEAGEIFHEDWDGCIDGWRAGDGTTVETVADPTTPSANRGQVEKLTRLAEDGAGTMYSSWLSLAAVKTTGQHCLGAWVRWVGGNAPFLGIRRYDANQVDLGVDERLIGPVAGSSTCGSAVPCPSDPNAFRYYHKSFSGTAGEFLQVVNGIDATPNTTVGSLSYVDVLTITEGACAVDKPTIEISGTLTAWATSPLGASVVYSASAADPVTGASVPVTCTPASGTFFERN